MISLPAIMTNASHTDMHVVRCAERFDLATRHPHAAALVHADDLSQLARFPGATDDFPLLFYLLGSNERVCAYFRTVPDLAYFDQRPHQWAWTGDNFTLPEYRGQGLSTKLQSLATKYLHERNIGRGSVFSTDVTLRIFRKLGLTVAGYAQRFLALRSARPLLEAHIGNPTLRRAALLASQPASWLAVKWLAARGRRLFRGFDYLPAHELPEDLLNELLARSSEGRQVHFSTEAALLWGKVRLGRRVGDLQWSVLRERGSGNLVGYTVVRQRMQEKPLAERYKNFRLMTLMDFGLADGDERAAEAVLGHVIRQFAESHADVLEVISSHPVINLLARRCGLLAVGKGMSFSYAIPREWTWSADLTQIAHWPLTHFCGDAFAF